MQTTDASCVIGLVLALLFIGLTLVFLSQSPVSVTSLTGPDATEATDDDLPTGNGEPLVIEDSIITVYAPGHLHALGYVRVPSQQHRQRLEARYGND